ncbi:MAG: MBL fold metallo-hydrolase [Christensenellaceae bacterium]|nr:MBL fold metallo-hydrolase [Christensenellaceae bacterium]
MQIKWYGHSSFLLTDSNGVRILTDPCAPGYGYELPSIEADAVTVSHDHKDHNYISIVTGSTTIIRGVGEYNVNGVNIKGFETFHDRSRGALRGKNIMFVYEMDDMRVLHCGDLGAIPDQELLDSLGQIDILLVPIGAIYTIDDLEARELANLLKPRVVIPMHYKTPKLKIDLCPLAPFIDAAKDCRIHNLNDCEASVSRMSLGEDRVIVLRPYDAERDEA